MIGLSEETLDIRTILAGGVVVVFVSRIFAYFSKLRDVGYVKSVFTLFSLYDLPGPLIPHNWCNAGLLLSWYRRHNLYQGRKSRVTSVIPVLYGKPALFVGSREVMKQVMATKSSFDKAPFSTRGQSLFARNVISSFGDEWPRHRKVIGPAFNLPLHQQVWAESIRTYHGMTAAEDWDIEDSVLIPDVIPLASKFTMVIITATGFGLPLSWNDPPRVGDNLTLQQAFQTLADNLMLTLFAPEWAYHLPIKALQDAKRARDMIVTTMRDIIAKGRSELAQGEPETPDIFNHLLRANQSEGAKTALSDEELMSNIYILLLAGHHTSANTLGYALGLLACYPEEQEKLHNEITSVLPEGTDPAFEDFEALRPVQSCLLESLRLLPVAPFLSRTTMAENAVLRLDHGEPPIFISKGVEVVSDLIGPHYDPEHYPNPTAFIPSRWSDKSDLSTEDFLMFGYGPRACVGRKFALYEMTCWLALFLREWRVDPQLERGENLEGWRKRVLEDNVVIGRAMGPKAIPLKLTRRT